MSSQNVMGSSVCHRPEPVQFGVEGERERVRWRQLLSLHHIQHPHLQLEHFLRTCRERVNFHGMSGV